MPCATRFLIGYACLLPRRMALQSTIQILWLLSKRTKHSPKPLRALSRLPATRHHSRICKALPAPMLCWDHLILSQVMTRRFVRPSALQCKAAQGSTYGSSVIQVHQHIQSAARTLPVLRGSNVAFGAPRPVLGLPITKAHLATNSRSLWLGLTATTNYRLVPR